MIVKHKTKGNKENRKIEVDEKRKRVKISAIRGKNDDEPREIRKVDKTYQKVRLHAFGSVYIAECVGDCLDVFSIRHALKVCSAKNNAQSKFFAVCGEVFIKITEDNKQQRIYDEVGHLIASDNEYELSVVFSGTEPCLQKVDKETNKKSLYSFEGTLVG